MLYRTQNPFSLSTSGIKLSIKLSKARWPPNSYHHHSPRYWVAYTSYEMNIPRLKTEAAELRLANQTSDMLGHKNSRTCWIFQSVSTLGFRIVHWRALGTSGTKVLAKNVALSGIWPWIMVSCICKNKDTWGFQGWGFFMALALLLQSAG